jgi:hypothetical protein
VESLERRRNQAARVAKRRKLIMQLENTLTHGEYSQIRRYFGNRCAYCGCEGPLHQEHLTPVSRGGGRTMANIVVACRLCNSSKGTKTFEEWYPSSPVYSIEREVRILNRPLEAQPTFYDVGIRLREARHGV